LMEQAPNFSTAGIAFFGYCLFQSIKSKANNEINKKRNKHH